jgi:hypothetical protein
VYKKVCLLRVSLLSSAALPVAAVGQLLALLPQQWQAGRQASSRCRRTDSAADGR